MTIQFLKYIVAVAEIGSITEAAKQLHISQPSLSAALKEAEKEVGFEILWTLIGFELLIATIGTIATSTWIGAGLLIQKRSSYL